MLLEQIEHRATSPVLDRGMNFDQVNAHREPEFLWIRDGHLSFGMAAGGDQKPAGGDRKCDRKEDTEDA
jgi:hypothetical protein